MYSYEVSHKGRRRPCGATKLADAMAQSGFPKLILKTDNEPAIWDLKRAGTRLVREKTTIEVVPEESKRTRQSHQWLRSTSSPGGRAQSANVVILSEHLHGVTLLPNHPLPVWAVEYVSQITNRSHTHTSEGQTAIELRRGKSYRRALPSSFEKATAMVLGKEQLKNEYRTFEAIFVGLAERSDMVIVMDPRNGAQKVSTVKRLSQVQTKDGDMVMALCGCVHS